MSTNLTDDNSQSFKVFVRIRPLNEKEENSINNQTNKKLNKNFITVFENQIIVNNPEGNLDFSAKKEKNYFFDDIFQESYSNLHIFDKTIKTMVDKVLQGFNTTALAYGVTGAGKTHTMFGDIYSENNQEKGICTFAIDDLFEKITKDQSNKSFSVKISYLEIYNEQVIDLLTKNHNTLMIIEDPVKGIFVPELSEFIVNNTSELSSMIVQGNAERTMAATGQNQFSSRSHAILQIVVEQNKNTGETLMSKYLMVDLAGSERGSLEKGIRNDDKGIRLQEGSNINKSLLALGNCINLLSDKSKKGSFVPYRDSKLTRLLKDSLGGNIQTIMIACISPSLFSYDDTVNTLNYAFRARKIQKKIYKNYKENDINGGNYRELIISLRQEINQLKEIIRSQNHIIKRNTNDNVVNGDKPIIQNTYSNIIINNINTNDKLNNKNDKLSNNYNVNTEIYEKFLTKCTSVNEVSFDDLELFIDNLQCDKVYLEDMIEKGVTNEEMTNKYLIIKSFYEKYLEIINDKMVDNIEQNLILNFNLKEINELNNNNQQQIEKLLNQKENFENNFELTEEPKDLLSIEKEIENTKKIILENENLRQGIIKNLEKNIVQKKNLKAILLKLISNSNKKEVTDWHQAYRILEKENKALLMKNYKYQGYITSLVKEKEEIENKYDELLKDYEKLKAEISQKSNKFELLENILKEKFALEDEKDIFKNRRRRRNKKHNKSWDVIFSLNQDTQSKTAKFIFFDEVNQKEEKISKKSTSKQRQLIKKKNRTLRKDYENLLQDKNVNLTTQTKQINPDKINIDIQSITPLTNFKIDFENCQFHRLESKPKKIGSKEKVDQIMLTFNKKLNNKTKKLERGLIKNTNNKTTTSNVVPEKKPTVPSPGRNIVNHERNLRLSQTDNKKVLSANSIMNIVNNNMNNSLSISKVTIRNEICYNPDIEVLENFLNSELIEDDLKNMNKSVHSNYNNWENNEDNLIIGQLNDLISTTKNSNKELKNQIFSKIDPKITKNPLNLRKAENKPIKRGVSRINNEEEKNTEKLTDISFKNGEVLKREKTPFPPLIFSNLEKPAILKEEKSIIFNKCVENNDPNNYEDA